MTNKYKSNKDFWEKVYETTRNIGIIGSLIGVSLSLLCASKPYQHSNKHSNLESKVVQTAEINEPNKPKIVDYKTNDFAKDSNEVLLARMLFGEARNCAKDEKIAIAYTAINRINDGVKWNGTDIKSAILCPYQYSCFNKNDVNYKKLKDPEKYDKKAFAKCLEISRGILSGKLKNPVPGATHYHTKNSSPDWSKSSGMIDLKEPNYFSHDFYREK